MLYHTVANILAPFSAADFLQVEEGEIDATGWPLYDYNCDDIRRWFIEELELDGGAAINWADICGMHCCDDDPLHILRSCDTQVGEDGQPVDGYWEVSVFNRDDAEFWNFLLAGSPVALDVDWEPRQDEFSKTVLDWVRDNPDRAEEWVRASPSPSALVGKSDELDQMLKRIDRAIRQGRVSLD